MERVLIVDDEKGVRESLRAILEDEGFDADAVSTGEECLESVALRDYGAVLLDVWLPRLDGLEVLRSIGVGPGRPSVIMISGHGSIDTAVRATKMGAFDFLEKPLSLEKILLVVRNALRQRKLEEQNRRLLREVVGEPRILGSSPAAQRLRDEVVRLAPRTDPLLLVGEDGAGKGLFARALHAASPRAGEAFVEVHASGIPADRFAAEIFGGTPDGGAPSRGRLSLAEGGTLLLHDVEEVPPQVQDDLLRALGSRPVAAGGERPPDVRWLVSSTTDLAAAARDGHVREDLLRAVMGTRVDVPPLRERGEDLPLLAAHFLAEFSRHYGRAPMVLEEEALAALRGYAWPANVRELRNLMERLAIVAAGTRIGRGDLPVPFGRADSGEDPFHAGRTLREGREVFERQFILRRLTENDYNVTRTAQALGLERSHLHRKIKALGLD